MANRPTPTTKKPAVSPKKGQQGATNPKQKVFLAPAAEVVPAAPVVPESRDWLTRYEASDRLSCSLQTLANYERKGLLHPQRSYRVDGRGHERLVIVYSPDDVGKLAVRMNRGTIFPRDAGEVTGRAFDLFEEGKRDREVIRELRLTVEATQDLREKWKDAGATEIVVTEKAKEALVKIVGPFDSVTDLVDWLQSVVVIAPGTKRALERLVGPFTTAVDLVERVTALKSPTA